MKLLIVESPAKSKTISKYLGKDFIVLPSVGHVRDLDPHDGSVDVDHDFKMKWKIMEGKEKQLKEIQNTIKKVDEIYLATDPDREGEAISWHIVDILKERKLLTKPTHRVAFHEITKNAVNEAMKAPREIDQKLVDAYFARRVLDYLVGFKLSPVLWKKLPGCKSAGRVQSVALKLICERENEIETFKKQEYWTIEGDFFTENKSYFSAKLFTYQGKKLEKFDIQTKDQAAEIVSKLSKENYFVGNIERKKQQRKPVAPFTTSTLQQEASRKLGFSAKQTMQIAQKLYEGIDLGGETVGLITYMRTDSVNLSKDSLETIRQVILKDFGNDYLPSKPVYYDNKSKNAQEAHEAIRPTYANKTPLSIKGYLDVNQYKLYELIWKRTVASQMNPAELSLVAVDIVNDDKKDMFRANGSMMLFDGFMKLYNEDKDDKEDDDNSKMLPVMNEKEKVLQDKIEPLQHFTQPPPRYTEASLVKKMEELGIGRPSTYATILSVIQERNYVELSKKRFVPEDRGRVLTIFLSNYFKKYVEYDFTASLENELDDISNGVIEYKNVLFKFWQDFKNVIESSFNLSMEEITNLIDKDLGAHFFENDGEARKCPKCKDGRLGIKLGKFGGFIGCSNYPTCSYTKPFIVNNIDNDEKYEEKPKNSDLIIGKNEEGVSVYLKKGPYGMYLQLGEVNKEDVRGPTRVSIPKNINTDLLTLQQALFLLSLPKSIGFDGDKEVFIATGKYGPYLKKDSIMKSIPTNVSIFDVDIKMAHDLLLNAPEKLIGKELGLHPKDNKPVKYFSKGKFGPYIQHNRTFVSVPNGMEESDITLEFALTKLATKDKSVKNK